MTDWETTDDVTTMLETVQETASDRQLLLFACGCCRLVETKMPAVRYLADRFEKDARRPMTPDEKWSILSAVGSALLGDVHPMVRRFLMGQESDPWHLAANVARIGRMFESDDSVENPLEWEYSVGPPLKRHSSGQAAILREIVANPLNSDSFDPRWRTDAARGIASAIEESRAWDRMPILADALQDAGCEEGPLLDHCRLVDHVHRPGCWAIDRVLGHA
jgi:hypothetical protein